MKYCYADAKSAMGLLQQMDNLQAAALDDGLCKLDNVCGKAAYEGFADIMDSFPNDPNSTADDSMVSMGAMFRSLAKFMCLKSSDDKYCMIKMGESEHPPEEGDCTGQDPASADALTPACTTHLNSFEPFG